MNINLNQNYLTLSKNFVGKVKWIREESLTKIAAVEFLELSLSDSQGIIEEELNRGDGEIFFLKNYFNLLR